MKLCNKCSLNENGVCKIFKTKLELSKLGEYKVCEKCDGKFRTSKFTFYQPKPIKKISDKSLKLWNQAKKECFAVWGKKCFLCNSRKDIEVHHWEQTRSQNPSRKYDITNLIPLCKGCHNHVGADDHFYVLRTRIKDKICSQVKELHSISKD